MNEITKANNFMIEALGLKEIPGYPRYYVSPDAKIFSTNGRHSHALHELKPFLSAEKTLIVNIKNSNHKIVQRSVNHLFALAFLGLPPQDFKQPKAYRIDPRKPLSPQNIRWQRGRNSVT